MDMDRLVAKYIVSDLESISVVESKALEATYQNLDHQYTLPSRRYMLDNVLTPMWLETKEVVRQFLYDADSVALTTDCWTSLAQHSYITMTCHVIDKEMNLQSFVLDTLAMDVSHTSENLLLEVRKILDNWEISDKNIVFVSDNASDIAKALSELGEFPWIGCMAHTINLIVQAGLKEPNVAKLISHLKSIVTFFRQSNNAANQLRKYNKENNLQNYTLIQQVDHRWNSDLDMIERQITIRTGLNQIMADLQKKDYLITAEHLIKMKKLVDLLKCFKGATEILSGQNYPTSSLILPILRRMKTHLDIKADDSKMVKDVKALMSDKLETRYQRETCKKIIDSTCILDPRFKNKLFINAAAREVLIEETIELNKASEDSQSQIPCTENQDLDCLSKYSYVPLCSSNSTALSNTTKTNNYLHDFFEHDDVEIIDLDTQSLEDRVKLEMQNYLSCKLPKMDKDEMVKFNPIAWWKDNQHSYPLLSKAVCFYLNIPASSAPSERIFSLASNIVTKKEQDFSQKMLIC